MLALLITCAACSDHAPPEPHPAPEPATPGVEAEESAPAEPAPTSWPAEVEDLGSAIARFESVEACLAELRARTPTLAAEALGDLGYDAFFDDACRALDAVRRGDAEACDALSVSSARRGCRRRLALVAGEPSHCPEDPAIEGREPLCVAWAARSADLCRAVARAERETCEAVLAGEQEGCPRADRARCEAWVRRYASALGDERARHPAARAPAELHLDVVRVHPPPASGGAATEDPPIAIDLPQLERGVRLVAEGCAHRVLLDDRGAPSVLSIARPGLRAELALPAGAVTPLERPIEPLGASLELVVPEVGRARAGEGTFEITALERALGGELAGRFQATLPLAPGALRVEGRFRTFVRDTDALPEHCAGDTMPPR